MKTCKTFVGKCSSNTNETSPYPVYCLSKGQCEQIRPCKCVLAFFLLRDVQNRSLYSLGPAIIEDR